MTFDDGIVKIYDVKNSAAPGDLPVKALVNPIPAYFKNMEIGVTRMYEAVKVNQSVDRVIAIYPDYISVNRIAEFEDGKRYIIRYIQPTEDEFGIKILKLTLERGGEEYEIYERDITASKRGLTFGM